MMGCIKPPNQITPSSTNHPDIRDSLYLYFNTSNTSILSKAIVQTLFCKSLTIYETSKGYDSNIRYNSFFPTTMT